MGNENISENKENEFENNKRNIFNIKAPEFHLSKNYPIHGNKTMEEIIKNYLEGKSDSFNKNTNNNLDEENLLTPKFKCKNNFNRHEFFNMPKKSGGKSINDEENIEPKKIFEKNSNKINNEINNNEKDVKNEKDEKDKVAIENNDNDKDKKTFQIINNNENNFINNNIKIDYEQNFIHIEKGCQNEFGILGNYPLIQEFNQPEPLIIQGNKNEDIFNKEINDINVDITRPCSNTTICKNRKSDNIFAKEEDLFSEEENFSQNNKYKNNDNSDISIGFNQNYVFLEKKPENLNEERKNFYCNYNDINDAKNSINYQEQLRFFYKNYII